MSKTTPLSVSCRHTAMGDFRLLLEKTQYNETIEVTEKVYNKNSCIEYVVSSPKFSIRRWLSLTLFFNTTGILLNLHSQVNPNLRSTPLLFKVTVNIMFGCIS